METIIAWIGPLHPPFVHFAVACPILAFLALISQKVFNKSWLGQAAAALWILSTLSALASGITGHFFSLHQGLETQFSIIPPESASQGRLREHVLLGSFTLFFSFLTLWAAWRTFLDKPLAWKTQIGLGLVLALFGGLTGHEGGEMVYETDNSSPVSKMASAPTEAAAPTPEINPAAQTVPSTPSNSDPILLTQNYRKTLVKMNSRPWNSRTHGHRWVNTYVSPEAVAAYQKSDNLPEGSQVVKESFEDADGKPSAQPGPLYVMVKGSASAYPRTGGWQYALVWDHPAADNPENIKMPVRWLPGNPRLNSCVKCHDHFKLGDYVGGIPEGYEKK